MTGSGPTLPPATVRSAVAVVVLLAGTYVAFVAYRVLALVVFSTALRGSLLLGWIAEGAMAATLPVATLARAFGETPAAVAAAALATAGLASWIALRTTRHAGRGAALAWIIAVVAASAGAVATDQRFGVTLLAEHLPLPDLDGRDLPPEPMTLAEVTYFTGRKEHATTFGTLAWQPELRRFVLEDPGGQTPPVKLDLYRRPPLFGTSFDEMRDFGAAGRDVKPPPIAEGAAWLGQRVRVTGSVTSGTIRAHVAGITAARSGTDVSAAATPAAMPPSAARPPRQVAAEPPVSPRPEPDTEPARAYDETDDFDTGAPFALALWPGEGVPSFRARKVLAVHERPTRGSATWPRYAVAPGTTLSFVDTRVITVSPGALALPAGLAVDAIGYGPRRFLSREAYGAAGRSQRLVLEPGGSLQVLQYRAEGTWIVRHAGQVIAAPCDACAQARPEVEWWIALDVEGRRGWVPVTEETVEFLDRTF